MLNLTRAERLVVLFLGVFILTGVTINYLLKAQPVLRRFYNCANLDRQGPAINLDINKASQDDLSRLPGVGDAIALEIVKYRESRGGFKNIEELEKVKGIGPRKLEAIKEHVTIK